MGRPADDDVTLDHHATSVAAVSPAGSELASFASGVRYDETAVRAAIVQPWSNEQTEGHVTRLKLVKRQLYGRANVDLLRARMVQPA